jgi:hypothetical protein
VDRRPVWNRAGFVLADDELRTSEYSALVSDARADAETHGWTVHETREILIARARARKSTKPVAPFEFLLQAEITTPLGRVSDGEIVVAAALP